MRKKLPSNEELKLRWHSISVCILTMSLKKESKAIEAIEGFLRILELNEEAFE